MTRTEIRELETKSEWLDAFSVMNQLRTHLDEGTYLNYLQEMTTGGYRLFAASIDDDIVALAGVDVQINMHYGRHMRVYELVTDADHRSEGYGEELLSFVEEWAEKRDCEFIALSSGLQREDAHRFYEERAGMDRVSYGYKL